MPSKREPKKDRLVSPMVTHGLSDHSFPLAHSTHHMRDFLHDLIVIGVVLCDQDSGVIDSQLQSDDQIAHRGVNADQSRMPNQGIQDDWHSNAHYTMREKRWLNGKIVSWPTYITSSGRSQVSLSMATSSRDGRLGHNTLY